MLTERWCGERGVKFLTTQLAQDDAGPSRKILFQQPVFFSDPFLVPGEGCGALIVPPACGLGNDCLINAVETGLIACGCLFRGQLAVVEKMAVNPVSKQHPVFLVAFQTLVKASRAGRIVFSDRVIVDSLEHMFSVPTVEPPAALGAVVVEGSIPVLVRPVGVTDVEV